MRSAHQNCAIAMHFMLPSCSRHTIFRPHSNSSMTIVTKNSVLVFLRSSNQVPFDELYFRTEGHSLRSLGQEKSSSVVGHFTLTRRKIDMTMAKVPTRTNTRRLSRAELPQMFSIFFQEQLCVLRLIADVSRSSRNTSLTRPSARGCVRIPHSRAGDGVIVVSTPLIGSGLPKNLETQSIECSPSN